MSDNQRWILGFVVLIVSVFLLLAIGSYFAYWASDFHVVRGGGEQAVLNSAGRAGAWAADWIVGRGFGVFAALIPLVLIAVGLWTMRYRPPVVRRALPVGVTLLVIGSVAMGFFFDTRWNIFGSGLGGEQGIWVARWLELKIGWAGTLLCLIGATVLLAVYITRSTIHAINRAGQLILEKTENRKPKTETDAKRSAIELARMAEERRRKTSEAQSNRGSEIAPEPEASPNSEIFEVFDATSRPAEPKTENQKPKIGRDGIFEVVEAGAKLGVGGVAVSDGRSEGMEVIKAQFNDALLDQKDLDAALYDPTLELSKYQRPTLDLLEDHSVDVQVTEEEIHENKNRIVETLGNFGIAISKVKATIGPTVTLYEIVPAPGVRIAKIKNLEDDIALSLSALGIRIIAPIPGKGTIGIEVPNKDKEVVSMQSVVRAAKFQESKFELPVVLGKTIQNETFIIDLAKMPHLLVAGATGQGKSVGLNAIITSLLYKKHPAELKFVLVDPKKVELTLYSKLEKHFLAKIPGESESIITDTQKVIYTLNSLCVEMDTRYDLLRQAEVRHVKEYNEKFTKRRLNPNKGHRYLPYIVVVIDEFADMIMTAGREIETPIARIAQLARAVGIHLVIATQRPTTNIITGVIKANFPARIAFRVSSMIDSRTIIDMPGANQLIGRGDMLISTGNDLVRVQCAFIDTPEIEKITEFIHRQRGYPEPYELPEYLPEGADGAKSVDMENLDGMFEEVARFVVQYQQGSTSAIQRRFSIGYNRAGRIMDQLEAAGIVGGASGSKPREVLIQDVLSLESML